MVPGSGLPEVVWTGHRDGMNKSGPQKAVHIYTTGMVNRMTSARKVKVRMSLVPAKLYIYQRSGKVDDLLPERSR